jgi:DNA polymerase III gamma/tau subunit
LEKLSVDGEITLEHASQVLGLSGFASLEKLFQSLSSSDAKGALDEIQQLYVQGFDLQQFNKGFLEYMRKQLVASVESGNNAQTSQVVRWLDIFREAYDQARYSPLPSLALEIAVVKACGLVSAPVAAAPLKNVQAASVAPKVAPVVAAPVQNIQTSKPTVSSTTAVADDIPRGAMPITAAIADSMAERTHQGLDVSFDMVKSKWPRILEHLKSPPAKRAFQGSRLHEVSDGTITLGFATNFHMEKMMEVALRIELEGALSAVLGQDMKVKGLVLKGVPMSMPTPVAAAEPERDEQADNIAAMFAE